MTNRIQLSSPILAVVFFCFNLTTPFVYGANIEQFDDYSSFSSQFPSIHSWQQDSSQLGYSNDDYNYDLVLGSVSISFEGPAYYMEDFPQNGTTLLSKGVPLTLTPFDKNNTNALGFYIYQIAPVDIVITATDGDTYIIENYTSGGELSFLGFSSSDGISKLEILDPIENDTSTPISNIGEVFSDNSTLLRAKGYVLTIDGMQIMSIIDPLFPHDFSHYLYDAIYDVASPDLVNNIEEVAKITHFNWSRLVYDTEETMPSLIKTLETYSTLAKRNHAPFIVVSHSWGTVLTYIAADVNSKITIDKLITLGSPLGSGLVGSDLTADFLSIYDMPSYVPKRPHNIKSWTNYWADCDFISGPIKRPRGNKRGGRAPWVEARGIDNIEISASGNLGECHSAYLNDKSEFDSILSRLIEK